MINIIKRGTKLQKNVIDPDKKYKVTCYNCGCEFECQDEDFIKLNETSPFVKCPQCDCKIFEYLIEDENN